MSKKPVNNHAGQMCKKNTCSCENKTCDYLHKQYALKRWVFNLIIIVISMGAIVPFASEAICTIWFPNVVMGLNTWNQFVSIVLGIIATILSIVSIIMGFKNYDDSLSIQEKYMQSLTEISNIAKDLSHVKDDVRKMSSMQGKIQVSSQYQPAETLWGNEPQDVLNSFEAVDDGNKEEDIVDI